MNRIPPRVAMACLVMTALFSFGCDRPDGAAISLEHWPETKSGVATTDDIENQVDSLIAIMTLEELVGQTIQADINSISPADIADYPLGSVLNGGNSAPGANNKAAPSEWLALADEYWNVSTTRGGAAIPILWGTDAVHGHNNIVGATVFPHNIGLGAARNADLIRRIGEVTARETRVTGQDWTFAPTLAVVRDDRWGRTYEGYSEDPEIVADYAAAMVEGLQGLSGTDSFLSGEKVIATAKHFLGDGGTHEGKDQGDNRSNEAELSRIHGAGYPPAIEKGVQTVMASFSSWQGDKLHGSGYLLTDVLKGRLGFNGFIVGDWNGHGQVEGCESTSCAASFNAGVDMFMAPDSWRDLFENTLAQVESGEISRERLEDAVRRILRVKLRTGLFTNGAPSERPLAGQFELLGSPDHLAVARQAVRESLVLLKNQNGILPIAPTMRVLVAGDGADNIGKQSGGWTLNWQGTGHANSDFPNGQSIWDGIEEHITAAGGSATLSTDGRYTDRPDVAIVVFGEDPYAEFQGDREHLDYDLASSDGLSLLQNLKDDGIPTVSIFLSGRPMWINPEINASDAFVAAWLPGTQGGGIADVIFSRPGGNVNHDFHGKLSFSWPRDATQTPLNYGDAEYDPLFAYGFGLSYGDDGNLDSLPEDSGLAAASDSDHVIFSDGRLAADRTIVVDSEGETTIGESNPAIGRTDRFAQEDVIVAEWSGEGSATMAITGVPVDLTRESTGDMALSIEYMVAAIPEDVSVGVGCGDDCAGLVDVTEIVQATEAETWTRMDIKLSCFASAGADMSTVTEPLIVRSEGSLRLMISNIRLVTNEGAAVCPGDDG